MKDKTMRYIAPFNGPVEIGLRALSVLNEAYPVSYSLQRLVIFDYLLVHSDDIPGGPSGLHPKTPHRSGELLVRRDTLQRGILLYIGRRLIQQCYEPEGVRFMATEYTGAFLDVLTSEYIANLRERARWIIETFGIVTDTQLDFLVKEHLGEWGAEFVTESILWMEDPT